MSQADPAEAHRLALSTAAALLAQAIDVLAPIDADATLHARGCLHLRSARVALRIALEDAEASRAALVREEQGPPGPAVRTPL